MVFIFFDELGVEPLAYVGIDTDLSIVIPSTIHKQLFLEKTELDIKYSCGRYVNTKEDTRIINTEKDNRVIQSPLGEGECK